MPSIAATALLLAPLAFEPDGNRYIGKTPRGAITIENGGGTMFARGTALSWRFGGANSSSRLAGETRLPGVRHRFTGNNPSKWRVNIPTYSQVRESELYPGIDLLYYASGPKLEYDLVVAPGADLARVRILFDHAKPSLDEQGALVLRTDDGELLHHAPIGYQEIAGERRPVAVHYQIHADGAVGFDTGGYDRNRTLIIDPVIVFASFLGGNDDDSVRGVAVDSTSAVYLTGRADDSNFPGPTGGFGGGAADAYVVKMNSAGTAIVFGAFLGGGGEDIANSIAVDSQGNSYITGITGSLNFPGTSNAVQPRFFGGISDVFVAKLDPTGRLVWATYLGGSFYEEAFGIAVDASSAVYVAGSTRSFNYPTTAGSFQPQRFGSDLDGFITKLQPNGAALAYSTFLLGAFDDQVNGIAVDNLGAAYVVGSTASADFPVTAGAFRTQCNFDAFLLKLNPNGATAAFATCYGGSRSDSGNGIALGPQGAVYITGTTASSDIPRLNPFRQRCGEDDDAFIARFSATASQLVYASCLGGGDREAGIAIAVSRDGTAYLTGRTESDDFPVTSDAVRRERAGDNDAFLTVVNPGGGLLSSTYLGGGDDDAGLAVAVDGVGAAYVGGTTSSNDFPIPVDAFQRAKNDDFDGFIARLLITASPSINPNGIVPAGGFARVPVAPGSIATLFGSGLAGREASATNTPLPTQLETTVVRVNGAAVPLFYVSPNQINFQLPYDLREGTATATVSVGGVSSPAQTFTVRASSPSLFVVPETNRAIAQNQNGTMNSFEAAAAPGSVIVVYFTGAGPLDNPVPAGREAPLAPLSRPILAASATIGGQPAAILFIGRTPRLVGVSQANLIVPSGLSTGSHPVVITVGEASSSSVNVFVR